MRTFHALVAAAVLCAAPVLVTPAQAVSPIPVVFGTSWDGPGHSLQGIVDAYVGSPGAINVQTDFVGAHAGELYPWFWVGNSFPALMITEVAGNANTNTLGWYKETGVAPILDGIDDGIVFTGAQGANANVLVVFPAPMTRFGFFLDPQPANHGAHQVFF